MGRGDWKRRRIEGARDAELTTLAHTLRTTIRDADMTQNALEAFTYLRARAHSGEGNLTSDDVVAVLRYFEDLGGGMRRMSYRDRLSADLKRFDRFPHYHCKGRVSGVEYPNRRHPPVCRARRFVLMIA